MYKLLIVDDEEIEREGMVNLIPWPDYDVELAGSAWNGVEGFEKIKELRPDIVLTDIKMPVMDGIELIKRTREAYPETEFVVLSGYGEYEFTSRAMEEGVRHYILKPCDEEKIIQVLDKVKAEIEGKRTQKEKQREARETIYRLMPRAREQVFRDRLLGREPLTEDYQSFLREYQAEGGRIRLIALGSDRKIGELEQFVFGNVLGEFLGIEKVLLSAVIRDEVVFMIGEKELEDLVKIVKTTRLELNKMFGSRITAAISDAGQIEELSALYGQIRELFQIGEAQGEEEILYYGMFRELKEEASELFHYEKIAGSKEYAEILFEVLLAFRKMELKGYSYGQKEEAMRGILKLLYGKDQELQEAAGDKGDLWELYRNVTAVIARQQGIAWEQGKEKQRLSDILLATFRYIGMPELNIQFLAREILFMNEDYFGRIFVKNQKVKFSAFLLEQRIRLATELLEFDPDLKISLLAEMTGYAPDGQYFSKAFRKVTGVSPSEYRDRIKGRN